MKLSKEVKIGVVVVGAIAMFVYGFNLLKGKNLFSQRRTFFAVYTNVAGLVESNPVLINGLKVGQVNDIFLHPNDASKIVVAFFVDERKLEIPKNSSAKIFSSDLMGSKAIEIVLGNEKSYAITGDTLGSTQEDDIKTAVDKRIAPLQKKAESLISSIDSVMIVVQQVLNSNTRANLTQSFENIRLALENLALTSRRLDTMVVTEKGKFSSIFSKIDQITGNLAANNEKITGVISNLDQITDSLAQSNIKQTMLGLQSALAHAAEVLDKINKGEGTMGLLVNDKRLYNHLDSASVSLDNLLKDLNEHPKRYVHLSVFGKSDKKKKSP